jgi:hypothetical protein
MQIAAKPFFQFCLFEFEAEMYTLTRKRGTRSFRLQNTSAFQHPLLMKNNRAMTQLLCLGIVANVLFPSFATISLEKAQLK